MRSLAMLLALLSLGAPACVRDGNDGRPVVVTGLYPLAEIARRVGGSRVVVVDLAAPGVEPHDLELTPAQVGTVEGADLVLYVDGLQPALDAAIQGKAGLDVLATAGGGDRHIWLDPNLLHPVPMQVADRLSRADRAHTEDYLREAHVVQSELRLLGAEIGIALQHCARRDIVTSHAAFGRFASRYGLRQTSTSGADPEAEPSPRRIADVAAFAKKNGVTTVFAESADDKTARTVAREAGAEVAVLDPAEIDRGTSYAAVMRANVTALRTALDCT